MQLKAEKSDTTILGIIKMSGNSMAPHASQPIAPHNLMPGVASNSQQSTEQEQDDNRQYVEHKQEDNRQSTEQRKEDTVIDTAVMMRIF